MSHTRKRMQTGYQSIGYFFLLNIITVTSRNLFTVGVDFYCFLNRVASSVNSSNGDSDFSNWWAVWIKISTWAGSILVMSSEDITDQWNGQRIGKGSTPIFSFVSFLRLVSLFNGISTFVGYLMPKPFF